MRDEKDKQDYCKIGKVHLSTLLSRERERERKCAGSERRRDDLAHVGSQVTSSHRILRAFLLPLCRLPPRAAAAAARAVY